MEFIEGNLRRADLKRNDAILKSGKKNQYRIAFIKGQGGSTREESWNRQDHWHDCCKSKVPWRHKSNCPRINFSL